MDYQAYIGSQEWREKRAQRLAIDGYRCVVCKSEDDLQVHHLHYDSLGNEDVQNDLITTCKRHHIYFDNIERFQRYLRRQRKVDVIEQGDRARKDIQHGMARSEVQIDISLRSVDAQRPDRRSTEQVVKIDQADFIQAPKNRQ